MSMEMSHLGEPAVFSGMVDLAAERVGGQTMIASDEFFAPKENLLKPGRGVSLPEKYTDRGKWMDGWETRRKRTPGHDWCIIRLGLPGVIQGLDIDTNHFLGNHPSHASLDACVADRDASAKTLTSGGSWTEILHLSPIKAGSQNLFPIKVSERWTHIRLKIYPDGGVARLRVYGRVVPDWTRFENGQLVDLASLENGGVVIAANDMHFGKKENLNLPGSAASMGDGWETRRRRGPGHDWVVVKLGRPGQIRRIVVDTSHFKGNYPDRCSVDGSSRETIPMGPLLKGEIPWKTMLPETKLEADREHRFEKELTDIGSCGHVRLNIYPDGGVSRLRVFGVFK